MKKEEKNSLTVVDDKFMEKFMLKVNEVDSFPFDMFFLQSFAWNLKQQFLRVGDSHYQIKCNAEKVVQLCEERERELKELYKQRIPSPIIDELINIEKFRIIYIELIGLVGEYKHGSGWSFKHETEDSNNEYERDTVR